MTKEELDKLKDWIATLSPEEAEGAKAAIDRIVRGRNRKGGGGGGGYPPEIEVDPDLEEPEDDDPPRSGDDDDPPGIDDPEELLKKKEQQRQWDKESEEAKKEMADQQVDDDDSDLPDQVKKDQEEEERKQQEIFRRKVEVATLRKEIKKALKNEGLAEETKKALEELDKTLESLAKQLAENGEKNLEDMSGKAFSTLVNDAYDLLDKAGRKSVTVTDVSSRLDKIRTSLEDVLELDELEDEDNINIGRDPETIQTREQERIKREMEAARGKGGIKSGGVEAFKKDLLQAIGDQIQEMIDVEEDTYAIVNRRHEDDDMVVPGVRIDEIPEYKKPSINVYFDQSGSWSEGDVEKGMAAIADLLDLEKEELLVLKIAFFSKILSQDRLAARREGSQECWDWVIDDIKADKAKNVIIMTDSDIGYDYRYEGHHGCINGKGLKVPGCVWFLWKHGSRVAEASMKLRGASGTFEYSI